MELNPALMGGGEISVAAARRNRLRDIGVVSKYLQEMRRRSTQGRVGSTALETTADTAALEIGDMPDGTAPHVL